MEARYSGFCKAGKHSVKAGERIVRDAGGWSHAACTTARPARREDLTTSNTMYGDPDLAQAIADEGEYQKGIADGERYLAEKQIYGEALAERFQAEDEFNRYWKNGEEF